MKKFLYIRSSYKAFRFLMMLMPCFISVATLAVPSPNSTVTTINKALPTVLNPNEASAANNTPAFIPGGLTPPVITCHSNIVAVSDIGDCGAVVNYLKAFYSDPDGVVVKLTWTISGATTASSPLTGINNLTNYHFNLGVSTLTYVATDNDSLTASCSFTIAISDIELPLITCPNDTVITIPSCSLLTGNIVLSNPVTSDNCGVLTVFNNAPPQFTEGTTSVIWTVNDINGNLNQCEQKVSVVHAPDISLSVSTTPVKCFGGNDGTATVSVTNGVAPFSYAWSTSPVQTTATANGLTAGTYTITVKDANNCSANSSATVDQPAVGITGSIVTQKNVTCFGSATGSVTVAGSGGTPPYQYNINGGAFQPSATFNNLAAGTYAIIVKDANGCVSNLPVTITQPATLLAVSIASHTDALCSGQANGSATASASGGVAPYTYSWNTIPVKTGVTASGLKAGTYTVTVTDFAGCVKTANVVIKDPTPISVFVSKTNVACKGDASGTATALASGGKPPYTYAWFTTPIQVSATAINLKAGTYSVAVFDSLGCFMPGFVTITEPATAFTASVTAKTNVLCAGSNTGSVTVAGSGGVAPYQYNINGGIFQAGGTFSGLSGGAYTVVAKDANNCQVTLVVNIAEPAAPLTVTITSHSNVLCSGQANGSATAAASGGTSPYAYSWNTVPAKSGPTASGLKAGNYTVTVTDFAGCTKTANVVITEPTPIVVTVSKTNVLCKGEASGTATALASGGKPPYTYAWFTTPIQVSATATNLLAGTYSVAVFDSLGCFMPGFVTITEPATKFTATVTGQTNVLCASSNTGSVTVAGSGGIAPYQYNINGGTFQPSGTFNNLVAGPYTVIARDANNCEVTLPIVITSPANGVSASIVSQTNVKCAGEANGSVTVAASGGTPPYTYAWNTIPVQNTPAISNLLAGTYLVTSTDKVGCFVIDTVNITEPVPLSASITNQVNFDCATGVKGSVTVAGANGTPGYQYSLNGGLYLPGGTFTNLNVGNYTVTVKDANNCTFDQAVQIIVGGLTLAVDDAFTTPEDVPLTGNVMANDQVLCNLPTTVTVFTNPQHGAVIVNPDGTFTYTPLPNYNGTDSFTYTITDNGGLNSTATVTVLVDPVNDPPVIVNNSFNVFYNLPATGVLSLAGSYDPDGTALTFNTVPLVNAAHGNFMLAADGTYTYTPNLNYSGSDQVIVSVCDAGLPLPPACSNDTIRITVFPSNLPPLTVPEHVTLCLDIPFIGTAANGGSVFNGDSDPENNLPLTVNNVPLQDAAHGTFTFTDLANGIFSYTPDAGYSGPDRVVLSVCDSGTPVQCANDTIYFEIVAPIAANAGPGQVLCNSDVVSLVGNPASPGTGSWAFVSGPSTPSVFPATGNVAVATGLTAAAVPYVFSYTTTYFGCTATDTMQVINYIPPTAAYAGVDQKLCSKSDTVVATMDANVPLNGMGKWTQLSGPGIALVADTTNPKTTISVFAPGDYVFQWTITNGKCAPSADAVMVSFAHPATVDAGADLQTCDSSPVTISGATALNSTSLLWSSGGDGIFSDSGSLNPTYTPGTLDISAGSVSLTLHAANGSICPDATDLLVLTVQKTPVVSAGPHDKICVGKNYTVATASASDFGALQWTVEPAAAGTIVNDTTLTPTFTPAAGFTGTVALVLRAGGKGACALSSVTDTLKLEVANAVVANAGSDIFISPGSTATLSGSATGGSGFYAWNWTPAASLENASIQNPQTLPLFTNTTFALNVLDITTGCNSNDTVLVSIDATNNPLAARADYDTTLINLPVTVNVLANDRKPDGSVVNISLCGFPSHGIVVLNSDSTITYTPYIGFEGDDSFCYKICDTGKPLLCSDTLVYIRVKKPGMEDLHAYNGISPNQDGKNDVWKVKGIEKYPDNTVVIFNRWGDKLREFAGYNNTTQSWDGKNENGKPLPDGTYFYILDVKNVGVLKGWIYLRGK